MSVATTSAPSVPQLTSTNLLGMIGNTPLIRMERIARDLPGVEIYGKAEFFNPGGSVKDRAALNMILDGERTGKLTHDKIILDSTSGNTGIAYAMIGAYKGYKVKLCLPKNASMERKHVLHAYGAEMVLTDPGEGSDGAIRAVREIYIRINTIIRPTGRRITTEPRLRSWRRPTGASRTLWRAWAPAEHSWDARGDSTKSCRT